MSMKMGNLVYWHKNQVVLRTRLQPTQHADAARVGPVGIINAIGELLKDLKVDLQVFDTIPALTGLSNATASTGSSDFLVFTRIVPAMQTGTMQAGDGTASMGSDDQTLAVINYLNNNLMFQREHKNQVDLMPHWFWTGTDDITHGCPVTPPIPVESSREAGKWGITLSQPVDHPLQEGTGEGVMVFVLDTLPVQEQIVRAARANPNNTLLRGMTTGMATGPQSEVHPPAIALNYSYDAYIPDPSESATTGKDIYGRLVGFPMADHGLSIAGIIRDLTPGADIECVRVLNDYGVGDVRTLVMALTDIKNRMDDGKSQRVVINLSLVVLPPSDSMPDGVTDDILKSTRDMLYSHLQDLADRWAVITASAGNDSDPRDTSMNPGEVHFGPRYPAALAYDTPPVTTMIPVGAVNGKGDAAMYSNHPGYLGVATYAGELPRPDPWMPSAMSHMVTRLDASVAIDALRCVYTSQLYPALSVNDPHPILLESPSEYPMYQASNTWAYWPGTSFATPIISALAARMLQGQDPKSIDVRQAILDAATQETLWIRVGDQKEDIKGSVIMATQTWQPDDAAKHA